MPRRRAKAIPASSSTTDIHDYSSRGNVVATAKKRRDGGGVVCDDAPPRTWYYHRQPSANAAVDVYTANVGGGGMGSTHGKYLNSRIRRKVVRGLPPDYSYFVATPTTTTTATRANTSFTSPTTAPPPSEAEGRKDRDDDIGAAATKSRQHQKEETTASTTMTTADNDNNDEEDDEGLSSAMKKKEATDETEIHTTMNELRYTYVPLPRDDELSTGVGKPGSSTTTNDNNDNNNNGDVTTAIALYSKFTAPLPTTETNSNSNAYYKYSPNYDTHMPNRNVIGLKSNTITNNYNNNDDHDETLTTTTSGGGAVGGEMGVVGVGPPWYVLQMPMTAGTVIAYSPPPSSSSSTTTSTVNGNVKRDEEMMDGGAIHDVVVVEEDDEMDGEFPNERHRSDIALYRILWDGYNTTSGMGYVEDVTESELVSCLQLLDDDDSNSSNNNNKDNYKEEEKDSPPPPMIKRGRRGKPPKNTSTATATAITTVNYESELAYAITKHVHATTIRKQLALEWKVECTILPQLVAIASLELRRECAVRVRMELLIERRRKQQQQRQQGQNNTTAANSSSNGKDGLINQYGTDFGYYNKHPNQYMSSYVALTPLPDDDDDDYDSDIDVSDEQRRTATTTTTTTRRRSKTKLTPAELIQYHERLEKEINLPPSKIAERIKLACSMAYMYTLSCGVMEEYYVYCDIQKERERNERERMALGGGGGGGGSSGGGSGGDGSRISPLLSSTGEIRRSSRPRAVVNYAIDGSGGAAMSTTRAMTSNGIDGPTLDAGDDGGLPRDNVSGGPTALYLLKLLNMLPADVAKGIDHGARGTNNRYVDSVEEDEEEKVDADPFFEPNPCLIIDQLGRKQRYLSPASIQSSIMRFIEDQIDTPTCLLDEEELLDIARNRSHHYVTELICTTEDKVVDMGQYEPASFARCRFAPRTFLAEIEEDDTFSDDYVDDATAEEMNAKYQAIEDRKVRREQRRIDRKAAFNSRNAELERTYRAQKSFELWRFRCIHGDGCTIFPLWRDVSREVIKGMITSGCNEMSSSSYAATFDERTHMANTEEAAATMITSNSEASLALVSTADVTQNDEELARLLAATADAIDDDNPLSKRRRTTRRAVTSTDGKPAYYGGQTSMSRDALFDPIIRLLQPVTSSDIGSSSSLMDLRRILFPDSYDTSRGGLVEMKKLRLALGTLVYKLGKVGRLIVNVKESDAICWNMLRDSGSLVKYVSDGNDCRMALASGDTLSSNEEERNGNTNETRELAVASTDVAMIDANGVTINSSPTVPTSSLSSAPALTDPQLTSQFEALERYVSNLHRTELLLRNSLMKAIDKSSGSSNGNGTLLQLSTYAISTASDEVEGSADAEDWKIFFPYLADENKNSYGESFDKIKWSSTTDSHPLIGQFIYRPQYSPLRPSQQDANADFYTVKCFWYRIVAYTPSIEAVEEGSSGTGMTSSATRDNMLVERRMRFRAVPAAEADIDTTFRDGSAMAEIDTDDDEDIEYMILTEGQARAGVEAAMLHHKIVGNNVNSTTTVKSQQSLSVESHPYRNRYGCRVMLTPQQKDGEDTDRSKFKILYGTISGYDVVCENSVVSNRVLILLEEDDENADDEDKTDPGLAFWSTIIVNSDGTSFLTDINPVLPPTEGNSSILCSMYNIDMHEFHQGSEAYSVCLSIISYLKSQSKIGPFLQPVDHIAMGLVDYLTVVKNPMDVSTLEKNLSDGKYSRVRRNANADVVDEEDDVTDHPVYRMVYGDFNDAVMSMFDNCIKYNGEASWIGGEATILKKNATKKIQQVVSKAVWQGQVQGQVGKTANTANSSTERIKGAGAGVKSKYVDEESDVDMYEYESDEDEYDGSGSRKRKSRKDKGGGMSNQPKVSSKNKSGKEEIVLMAIEQPFAIPETAKEFSSSSAFPHIKVKTNVGKFAFSQELWSCRYVKGEDANEGAVEEDNTNNKKGTPDVDDDILLLMQLQQQEDDSAPTRRSTRERHAPVNYADELGEYSHAYPDTSYANETAVTIPGVEYYLTHTEIFQSMTTMPHTIPTVCRSRLGAEGIQEMVHESYFAQLYRKQSPNLLLEVNGIGTYANGSFPPYLGRVLPSSSSSSDCEDGDAIVWEIREQYLVPALRWVLRGLVRSGHLNEVDYSLSEGILEDAISRTHYGAGMVTPSHEYYYNQTFAPFDVLDEKEIMRKRRQGAAADAAPPPEVAAELSEYEQMRAARVARNAERLKALGLA